MKKNSGFSLGELLITVAILVVLMAVALPAVLQTQKNLRQKELDAKAEIIYVAAQNAISKLKAGGRTAVYQAGANGVEQLAVLPYGDPDVKEGELYFFTSESMRTATNAIMDRDTVDEALLNNHWVVEYNPSSAIIYAVFYSEDLVDCASGYENEFSKYNLLRDKEKRLEDGSKVGYYGGGSSVDTSTVTTLIPTLTIINAEKLIANVSCVLPNEFSEASDYPVFKVSLTDNTGNTDIRYYACQDSFSNDEEIKKVADGNPVHYGSVKKSGRAFSLELVLDDLSSDGVSPHEKTRFSDRYPTLKAGSALTVAVTAMCPGNYKYTQNLGDFKKTNSLFADSSTGDTAVISYARHLQNLDESSGVNAVDATITKAKQSRDITFTDEMPVGSSNGYVDWFETYGEKYFNGSTDGVPNFKPIQNSKLQSYDGDLKRISKLTIEAKSDAGLFAARGDSQTVSNVIMTGTYVKSQNGSAGALVGKVTGSAAIEQCQVYLTTSDIKGKDNHDVWIQGKTAGGLIGTVSGNGAAVTNSSASTVVGGHEYSAGAVQSYDSVSVGGLVGSVTEGSVSITGSYADCYLFGKDAGGLVGTSSGSANMNGCYAAGFATFQSEGAGLACGQAEMKNSYTVLCYQNMPADGWSYFSTAKPGAATKAHNVYYHVGSFAAGSDLSDSHAIGSMTLQALTDQLNDAGSTVFTSETASSLPYNLMNQGLTTYPFPVLPALKHYGDWMADFQEGTLVYYEEYNSGEKYGFYGANVESTLKDDSSLTVIGDGYGVVYQNKVESLPDSVAVTCEGEGSEPLPIRNNENYYSVTGKNGASYRIYPLSTELVNTKNASSDFYLSINIGSDAYFFNPHFAKTVVENKAGSATKPTLDKDQMISVRTPRHLYMMSLYYDKYAKATEGCTFAQERNIDYIRYDWPNYSVREDKDKNPNSQAPIAGGDFAFRAIYDGGCHWITNVNFTTENGLYVGFIGQNGKEGTIKDVVLTATYEEGSANNYHVRRSGNIENNRAVYMGVLVGRNIGTIKNCAVSGYYIAGSDGTIHAYENSYLYAGGLVGGNAGTIVNCSADTPAMRLSSTFSNAFLGGFVGSNSNYIDNCYALGHIEVAFARGGGVSIAGFAGRNTDIIRDSYCATALTASGDKASAYGFAPLGGQVNDCEYLNHGTYAYVNHMYPFNFDPCAGKSSTFSELRANSAEGRAVNSYNFKNTKTVTEQYPFRAVVRNESGNLVHYGDWLDDENMGDLGIFYWEHEVGGSNNGYHFTYLGTEKTGDTVQTMGGTTLCNAHDDGGVITEYGYGYFELNEGSVTELRMENAKIKETSVLTSGEVKTYYNKEASEALAKQMHKTLADGTVSLYNFYAFTTGKDGLCLSGKEPNCTWTLTQKIGEKKETYEYTVSPFFANAMSFKNTKDTKKVTAFDGKVTDYSREPGAGGGDEDNQYEIRSIQQLQYINWNYAKKNTSTLVTHRDNNDDTYKQFTYLMYAKIISKHKIKPEDNIEDFREGKVMHWRQTHDVDATGFRDYTPIAGNYESTRGDNNNYSVNLYAWFGGNYDGESYKIQNVAITSNSFSVGLFGVTVGANMKNIIMYSDNDTEIKRCATSDYPDKVGAYSLGGLIGVAFDYSVENTKNTIENCAIAGYRIVDGSTNPQGLGEANAGGLIGVANVHLKNCSAVTDIVLDCKPTAAAQWGVFIRVGGLTGAAQGTIENCYSGGSAIVTDGALGHSPTYISKTRYEIYIGGIAGSAFTSNYYNFTGDQSVHDGSPTIKNCYTYFSFPARHSKIIAMYPIASMADRVGPEAAPREKKVTIDKCYYLDSIMTADVKEIYNGQPGKENTKRTDGKPVSLTYTQMSDGTLLSELNGITDTGSVTKQNLGYHNVTTTEGSANVPINGKYSFPGSNYALEGKNYPFPAIVQQKDLTFGTVKDPVYVYVHYGDWPIDGPYWTRGRDTMDIFADMQKDKGYAAKTFNLNPNGKDLSGITKDSFTCEPKEIAEVVDVKAKDSNGLYPVTIKAKNTGTAVITFEKGEYSAKFSLEVTADIHVTANPESLTLKVREPQIITLSAKSSTNDDFGTDPNTSWQMKVVEEDNKDLIELSQSAPTSPKNEWEVKSAGLGKLTLKADFVYNYQGVQITSAAYVNVLQPDTVGLSDGQTQYNVAYLDEPEEHVSNPAYVTAPSTENGNFFLYLDAAKAKIENLTIESISVEVGEGVVSEAQKKDELGNVYYEATIDDRTFHVEWDAPTADKNYQYLPGSIYVEGTEKAENVKLDVKVKVKVPVQNAPGEPETFTERVRTLSITLPEVKKAVKATYLDGNTTEEHSFEKLVSAGKHKLPTQVETKELQPNFAIPPDKMLAGWKEGDSAPRLPGSLYDFSEDVTFTAVWKDIVVTLNANGGTFDGGKETEEMKPESGNITLSPKPTRGSYAFMQWNTKADGSGMAYNAGAPVDVSALESAGYTLYAQWKPYTLTLIKDGGSKEFSDVTGTSLPGYDSSEFTRAGYELDGWYTEPDSTGKREKVLDEYGNVVEDVSDYSKNGELELTEDQKLYACWYRSERFVLADTLQDDHYYLLVSTDKDDDPAELTVAFAPLEGKGDKNNPHNVEVDVKRDALNKVYIIIAQDKTEYAVFHCSDGGYLQNGAGYLNVVFNRDGKINDQYALEKNKVTQWGYYDSNQAKDYNKNILYDKSRTEDIGENPGSSTNARRLSYMGRRTESWAGNAFTVKATKDDNTDMYIYVKQDEGYEFSDDTVPGGVRASMYSARAAAPAESAALTLTDGNRTVLSTTVPSGAAPVTGYAAPTRVNSEWTLEGWYTAKDGTGTKVLNVDGTTAEDGLALSGDTTLYACWTRGTDIFVKTDTLEPDADYLLVLGSGEEARAVGQVGESVVRQPVTAREPGDGGYEVYDTETGDWSHVDSPYINVFSDQTVWHYAVDGDGNGTLTATDGSARENALWELDNSDISIYRRTTVRERSFEDEYLMLTLCTGTDCVTEVVTVADGAWSDAWSEVCRKLENSWCWFDSPDGESGVQVLDAEGRFAAENVADYVKDGRWVYDGSSMTLYARTPELPEAEPMDAMLLTTETEEDKKKRTPRKIRIDGMKV